MQTTFDSTTILLFVAGFTLLFVFILIILLLALWTKVEKFDQSFKMTQNDLNTKFDNLPSSQDLSKFFDDSLSNLQKSIESKLSDGIKDLVLPKITNSISEVKENISLNIGALFKKSVLPYLGSIGQKRGKAREQDVLDDNPALGLIWDELPPTWKRKVKNNPEMVGLFTDILTKNVITKLPPNLAQQVGPLLGYEIKYEEPPQTQPAQVPAPIIPKEEPTQPITEEPPAPVIPGDVNNAES